MCNSHFWPSTAALPTWGLRLMGSGDPPEGVAANNAAYRGDKLAATLKKYVKKPVVLPLKADAKAVTKWGDMLRELKLMQDNMNFRKTDIKKVLKEVADKCGMGKNETADFTETTAKRVSE